MEIGIKSAKADLSRLIQAVLAGEKVIITNHGKPLVRLVPEAAKTKDQKRAYGALKGVIRLPPGWDSLQMEEEFAKQFEAIGDRKGFSE